MKDAKSEGWAPLGWTYSLIVNNRLTGVGSQPVVPYLPEGDAHMFACQGSSTPINDFEASAPLTNPHEAKR